jgi:hypothetical protein
LRTLIVASTALVNIATASTPAAVIASVTVVVKRTTIVTFVVLVATAVVTVSTAVVAFGDPPACAEHDTALALGEVLVRQHIVAGTAGDVERSGGGRHVCSLD